MTSQITDENNNVSGEMSIAPEDALLGETGRALSPMTGANLLGDNSSALSEDISLSNSKLRPSIGLKKSHAKCFPNSGFKAPKMLNVKGSSMTVGPPLCSGTNSSMVQCFSQNIINGQ